MSWLRRLFAKRPDARKWGMVAQLYTKQARAAADRAERAADRAEQAARDTDKAAEKIKQALMGEADQREREG